MEGELLEEMRHTTGIGHLVPWSRIDHHSDRAKLAEPLLGRHPQTIGERGDLSAGATRFDGGVLDVVSAGQGIGERGKGSDNSLGWHIDGGARLCRRTHTVLVVHLAVDRGCGEWTKESGRVTNVIVLVLRLSLFRWDFHLDPVRVTRPITVGRLKCRLMAWSCGVTGPAIG